MSAEVRYPIRHKLKTYTEYFQAVLTGRKRFELRKDDRDFQPGDMLELVEYDPKAGRETGRAPIICTVGYVLRGPCFGLEAGFCIMQLRGMS